MALDALLVTPGAGPFAIAAGIALVALAGVASATLGKGPGGQSPGGASSYKPADSAGAAAPAAAPIKVIAEFVLRGKDLVAVGRTQDYRVQRTG